MSGAHAFGDESTRADRYLMCFVIAQPAELATLRRGVRRLRASGQRRIHFVSESDRRRRQLLAAFADLDIRALVIHTTNRDQVQARDDVLHVAVDRLAELGVQRLVLEARQGQDDRDRRTLYRRAPKTMSYEHMPSAGEPILWSADGIAWAWGRGGDWRRRCAPLVEAIACP